MHLRVIQVYAVAVFLAALAAGAQPPDQEPQASATVIDKRPPKYEYGYIVSDKDGNAQGHVESRDGVYALGRYYVNSPNGSGQKVTYFADDWGYHPLVTYASTSAKGSSRTQFAMGDKAIAALKDNGIADATAAPPAPSFTSVGLAAAAKQPSVLLVPPTIPTKAQAAFTASDNVIPTYEPSAKIAVTSEQPVAITATKEITTEKKTILHIPGLRQALRLATEPVGVNATVNPVTENGNDAIRLSAYLQPPDNASSTYNTAVQPVREQLTEEQHQNLYASASEIYLTTTMKPIVVSASEGSPAAGKGKGHSYNSVEQTSLLNNAITPLPYVKSSDSSPQSSDSVVVNHPNVIDGRNAIDQLAPLQAGLSLISSDDAKPVQESVEAEPVSYKTVVEIQEGISLDVTQDADGTLRLANFGDRITTEKPTQFQGLGYERRLVNPVAQDIVREADPAVREQKQADLLARQEAEILAVQKSIEDLQQQIISQIDAEHAEQEKKHESDNLQKVEALTQDQNSIQSSNTPVKVAPVPVASAQVASVPVASAQVASVPVASAQVAPLQETQQAPLVSDVQFVNPVPNPAVIAVQNLPQPVLVAPAVAIPQEKVPVSYAESNSETHIERESVGNNQIEVLPHRTVKSQNLAGILTLNPPPEPSPTETEVASDAASSEIEKDTVDLVPPPLIPDPVESEPVLVEPYPLEQEPKLLPASPSPTLFPVKVETPVIVEKPTVIESTKVVEKPVVVKEPLEVTKVVQVEKPVPVLQPYPVEVTKYVHVDRPVPVPAPYAVSHPVPVPVAVPHAVEVPVPHLIPVPEILPIALKEFYPVYIHKTKQKDSRPKPGKLFAPANTNTEVREVFTQPFKPEIVKKPNFQTETVAIKEPDFRFKQGITWEAYIAQNDGDLQFSDEAFRHAFNHFQQRESFRGQGGHPRNKNVLKNLRIEYGFKPPLRPSVEITEEVKPSIYGPSVRPH